MIALKKNQYICMRKSDQQYDKWIVVEEGPAFCRTFLLAYPSVDGVWGSAVHSHRFSDFITFVRHQMANNDNQRVTQNNWVFLGGASEKMYPLHHVRTQETQAFRLYKCGSGQ